MQWLIKLTLLTSVSSLRNCLSSEWQPHVVFSFFIEVTSLYLFLILYCLLQCESLDKIENSLSFPEFILVIDNDRPFCLFLGLLWAISSRVDAALHLLNAWIIGGFVVNIWRHFDAKVCEGKPSHLGVKLQVNLALVGRNLTYLVAIGNRKTMYKYIRCVII